MSAGHAEGCNRVNWSQEMDGTMRCACGYTVVPKRAQQIKEFEAAKKQFRDAFLKSWMGRALERWAAWLSRHAPSGKERG